MFNRIIYTTPFHQNHSGNEYSENNIPDTLTFAVLNNAPHQKILESLSKEVDYLEDTKEQTRIQQSVTNLKLGHVYNLYIEKFNTEYRFLSSWKDIYDVIDVTPLAEYDALFIMSGLDHHWDKVGRNFVFNKEFPLTNYLLHKPETSQKQVRN